MAGRGQERAELHRSDVGLAFLSVLPVNERLRSVRPSRGASKRSRYGSGTGPVAVDIGARLSGRAQVLAWM